MLLRRSLPALVAVALGAVTAVATLEGIQTDREVAATTREQVVAQTAQAAESLGDALSGRVSDLAGLFNGSDQVTAAEFSNFTEPMLTSSRAAALTWTRLVPDSGRAANERETGIPIGEVDATGKWTQASRRARYGVVTYTKTADDSEALLGLDVLAQPDRAAAIALAGRRASPQSTGRVNLRGADDPGFDIFVPVYGPNAGPTATRRPIGFVSGSFRLSDVRDLLGRTIPAGTQVGLRIAGAPAAAFGTLDGKIARTEIDVAGQRWQIAVSGGEPGAQAMGLGRGGSAAVFLGLLTLLITGLTWQAVAAAARSDELARLRQNERDQAVHERETNERATGALMSHLPDLAVLRFDADLRIESAAGGLLERAGWSRAEMEGKLVTELFGSHDAERLGTPMRRALAGESTGFAFDGIRDASLRYWIQTLRLPGDDPGGLMVVTNVSALMQAEADRDRAERRFERAFDDAPIGMAIIDRSGAFEQVNDALCAITGHSAEELAQLSPADISHADDVEASRGHLAALLAGRTSNISFENRFTHPDGHSVCVAVHATALSDARGEPTDLILAQVLDVTERNRFEEQLQHLADHDPLTGLRNRRSFEQALDTQLACVRRYGPEGAVLMLDLDHFKAVNDTFGHQAGDEILQAVANALRTSLRSSDTIGRLGGDEFAVLLPKADELEARIVAEKVGRLIRDEGVRLCVGGRPVTASVGVVVLQGDHVDCAEALAAADQAMYDAKQGGRDAYALART